MKQGLIHHQTENTYLAEFHSHICTTLKNSSPHFHKNFELLVVQKGSCNISVDGKEYELTEGQAAFILPFQIHKISIDDAIVRSTTIHENLILTLSRVIAENVPETPVFTPSPATYNYFCSQLQELFGENSGIQQRIFPPFKRIKVKGILYAIESEFLEQATLHKIKDTEDIAIVVLRYIADNFKDDISLRDIAANKGYNYQYLSRTFNYRIGISFKKLLNLYRMEHAYCAIQDTSLPISLIAIDNGFQSIRSFNKICLEIFGCSPKELRKKRREWKI